MEFENLIKLINTVSESNLTGFRYEAAGIKLRMKKDFGGTISSWGEQKQNFANEAIIHSDIEASQSLVDDAPRS